MYTQPPYHPQHRLRFVTASSLYDGHDASINIMRRILQASGVEVIHLGHNRSVQTIVDTAIQEDVQAIAVSSYQGGHVEFFTYMIDMLRARGASHIAVFGGGGGVIVQHELDQLHAYGVTRIYSPDDGRSLGLQGMIDDMMRRADSIKPKLRAASWISGDAALATDDHALIAELISVAEMAVEDHEVSGQQRERLFERLSALDTTNRGRHAVVIGVTGTGGAGKSSLTDELVRRALRANPEYQIAVLSVDPSRQKTGGALLGDRIRMNAIYHPQVYMRSLATRKARSELSAAAGDAVAVLRAAGFNWIFLETSGIGQGDSAVAMLADVSLYVMTSEYGAPSQLEKIDMLDYADLVAINKFDRRGSLDALRDVRKQVQRNQGRFTEPLEMMPVCGTMASQFNDLGTNSLYLALSTMIHEKLNVTSSNPSLPTGLPTRAAIIPGERAQYLLDVVRTLKNYRLQMEHQQTVATRCYQLEGALASLAVSDDTAAGQSLAADEVATTCSVLQRKLAYARTQLSEEVKAQLAYVPTFLQRYHAPELISTVRGKEQRQSLYTTSLSGLAVPRVAVPSYRDWGDWVRYFALENVPGEFPYTAGVFALKRTDEEPRRQFAGEGSPERTNRRFHYLSKDDPAKRLSTAFDSVTLYGENPSARPDVYGKIGESGVSVCTLEDMEKLFEGFDLTDSNTSVSMTINGPAPMLLAMFFNTAINQQLRAFAADKGREASEGERADIQARTLKTLRGTVQADILKEDQGQNTCIFSTEFALRMMGDIQQYFIDEGVRNYYSVSISGYHIAEAGANPISQLAFTLANAFTYVEYYLSRGMKIDDFAPNLSFFFSNGMDPEYSVMGRVARRIWAVAMRDLYGGGERSQKLKYHIQTSGRSLHAQEVDFNDIRTTLQALLAIYDNCNSLHTNAYDEAITTPTEDSVRRAMAIQLIINREFGLAKNENPAQGSFVIEELTDLVEREVIDEFVRLHERGGVLGAMETQYQRGKIQEESLHYETLKHSGELPIIGVNTFLRAQSEALPSGEMELARATYTEKDAQIAALQTFEQRHLNNAETALRRLQEVAEAGGNLFAELMDTVKVASLGQITAALYQVGGQYRRNL